MRECEFLKSIGPQGKNAFLMFFLGLVLFLILILISDVKQERGIIKQEIEEKIQGKRIRYLTTQFLAHLFELRAFYM